MPVSYLKSITLIHEITMTFLACSTFLRRFLVFVRLGKQADYHIFHTLEILISLEMEPQKGQILFIFAKKGYTIDS
jgi:hypothetical protein